MKKFTIIFPLLFVFATASFGNIINVPNDYPAIQTAIDASANGDTILVEPGTYTENIIFRGKKIVLTSRFYINNELSYITSTIINGSNPSQPDSASVVRIHNGEDSTTVLQGFTITGGKGTKWLDEHGAGRYTEGGGILIALCHPVIRYNIIENNECVNAPAGISSTGGGGIRLGDGHPLIQNNIIRNNRAMYGGGIVSNHSTCTIMNNVIYNNAEFQAVTGKPCYGGGGVWINGAGESSKLINNTILYNSASGLTGPSAGRGGGVLLTAVTVQIRNNIIWGNTQSIGAQLTNALGTGSYTIAYNDIQGGYTGPGTLTSNIDTQPLFDTTNYYLSNLSPCIDAGDTAVIYNDREDTLNPGNALFPSRGTLRNDIGAYGGSGAGVIANTVVSTQNITQNIPEIFYLGQNFPNPFNPSTKIKFETPISSNVKLKVFDITGRQVASLVNGALGAGSYEYTFDAAKLPSGIYFYSLIIGEFSETKRMILMK